MNAKLAQNLAESGRSFRVQTGSVRLCLSNNCNFDTSDAKTLTITDSTRVGEQVVAHANELQPGQSVIYAPQQDSQHFFVTDVDSRRPIGQ